MANRDFESPLEQYCTKPNCFFCIIKEKDSSTRRASIEAYLRYIPTSIDDEELILVVSGLWNIAMTRPDNQELPSLGIFECMAGLINKAINNRAWLLTHQNIYIPYYAAHIIGSYTMNKVDSAVRAVDSGVIPPLLELMRGKMSWVEQRVAVRALGHLASYEKTFEAVTVYEEEVVKTAMHLASSCLEVIYDMIFVKKRLKYHCDLLTRGVGGVDAENRKTEEWASQVQCWSIHLLNCFAIKERCIEIMCNQEFLEDLCEMWGGLVNHTSPAGVGLLRILCYTKIGREKISESRYVVENLCNLSRSCDDWQYMAIDCLLLLLKDLDTRYKVIGIASSYLVDLIELKNLANRSYVGEAISNALVYDFKHHQNSKIKNSSNVQREIQEVWSLRTERRKRERIMSGEKLEGKRIMANLIKQQGNHRLSAGEIEEAVLNYTEALEICPLRFVNERIVLYSNRAHCNLMLRDFDGAISDATRALCLSNPPNSHANSLWTRSQAYDLKGMAKESLMDCVMFINVCMKSKTDRIPYYAVRMICKQMDSTWLFRTAQLKASNDHPAKPNHSYNDAEINANKERNNTEITRTLMQNRRYLSGLSTILEEPFAGKNGSGISKKMERAKGSNENL